MRLGILSTAIGLLAFSQLWRPGDVHRLLLRRRDRRLGGRLYDRLRRGRHLVRAQSLARARLYVDRFRAGRISGHARRLYDPGDRLAQRRAAFRNRTVRRRTNAGDAVCAPPRGPRTTERRRTRAVGGAACAARARCVGGAAASGEFTQAPRFHGARGAAHAGVLGSGACARRAAARDLRRLRPLHAAGDRYRWSDPNPRRDRLYGDESGATGWPIGNGLSRRSLFQTTVADSGDVRTLRGGDSVSVRGRPTRSCCWRRWSTASPGVRARR